MAAIVAAGQLRLSPLSNLGGIRRLHAANHRREVDRHPHQPLSISLSLSPSPANSTTMAAIVAAGQLRLSPLSNLGGIRRLHAANHRREVDRHPHQPLSISLPSSSPPLRPLSSLSLPRSSSPSLSETVVIPDSPAVLADGGATNPPAGPGDNNNNNGRGGGGRWGPDDGDRQSGDGEQSPFSDDPSGPLELFLRGWRSRVEADPQFPFKVLMEELVGVTACVLGDMASRPNFGLNELDFVFSTLVVGSIVNFVLMYLLAPTAGSAAASTLPGIFAACPTSHMLEPGPYSLLARLGTFIYKGATFAAVGFAAGLAGTALSNGLIALRKKMDPAFVTPNKPPPTVLNATTWALHMGLSSNFRYQTLNGIEFVMEKSLPSAGFKASVVVLRCLNNVLGGMSFVVLARLTGAQKSADSEKKEKEDVRERLVEGTVAVTEGEDGESSRSES